jgi:ABC-2 type transport system ATP-binding protein
VKASWPHPGPLQRRGRNSFFKVLSFGEDLGEVPAVIFLAFRLKKYNYIINVSHFCAMAKQPIITVNNLVKNYGDFNAVKDISFEVYEGEIFGLLGPNGAGKTTTLEIIETLRDKTSGQIIVDGFDVDKDADNIKKRIGVQLQAAGYYPNLNLSELIELFSGLYGINKTPMEMLAKVALTDKAKAKYKELSGGQKQRFSIATTLINDPRIIFLDEPTTGLDPQARRNLWDLIREIRDSGTTVVITTHYMDEAEILCDRVAFVDGGRIIDIDTPDNFIDKLVASGFERKKEVKLANLEDVFINLTGKEWREG